MVSITTHIKNQTTPKGYNKTIVGILPSDWKLIELSKLAVILFSNVDKHILENEKKVLLCNYKDVYSNRYIFSDIKFSIGSVNENEYNKFLIKKGDVIITKDSEDSRDIAVPSYVLEDIKDLICGYHLAIIRPQASRLNGMYLAQLLQSYNINHIFQRLANGITRFGLNTDSVKKCLIPVPDINEQKKIAEILLNWDEAISICSAIIKVIKNRNKGLAQQLLTGKKRLNGFSEKWEEIKADKIFKNNTDKSHDGNLEILSATQEKGVIPRRMNNIDIKYDVNSLGSYKKVEKGDFVISLRSFQGGIEHSEYEGIVSPAYTILKEIIPISKTYYRIYFKTETFINRLNTIIYGIRDGKQISFKDFATLKLYYPPIEEQTAIAKVLETADQELKNYEAKLEQLQLQKKGLMQQLLTGKIRVNLNN